jgi:hypothetical protein
MSTKRRGNYFTFERGEWVQDDNKPAQHYPASGITYVGDLTREQRDELDTLIDGYLKSIPEKVTGVKTIDEGRAMNTFTKAAMDVLVERQRQIEAEGWTPEHDDHHHNGELAAAAACYASPHRAFKAVQGVGRGYAPLTTYRDLWPWRDEWWKPKERRRDLVRAAALTLAEIERLDRAAGVTTVDHAMAAAHRAIDGEQR